MVRLTGMEGIGTKYELETSKGDRIAVVFLLNRRVQLYIQEKGCEKPCSIEMSENESKRLATILSGAPVEKEKESIEVDFMGIPDLTLALHTYTVGRSMAGKTIEELAIRKRTGVNVIAVSRKGNTIISPPPHLIFEEEDQIVVIGNKDQIERFEKEILGA
ncbi:cation:proton antiporter regulatory subunit [Geoglobus acetivorans]|uniref:TrkA domain protein n=1 Tax=Geoglobus acetivorans TaxID=565033 RepID=A0A0A7GG63_GEOAI|nr:trkA domain protein [Geoglobus acetivorans]